MLFIAFKSAMYHFLESLTTSNRDLVMGMSSKQECCKIASFTNPNASTVDSPKDYPGTSRIALLIDKPFSGALFP